MGKTSNGSRTSSPLHVRQNVVCQHAQLVPVAPYWRTCDGYSVLNGVPLTKRHDGWWHTMRSHYGARRCAMVEIPFDFCHHQLLKVLEL